MRVNDQPSPSRNSPTARIGTESAGANAHTTHDTARIAAADRIIGTRPARSTSQPTTGENAYIPSTCTLITSPISCSETSTWPCAPGSSP